MPDVACAIDPTIPAPVPLWAGSPALAEPSPPVVEPGPGDPETPWVPPVFSGGLKVQVLLTDAVTHEPVDEIRTAVVDDFDEDVDIQVVPSAAVRCSLWDDTLPGQAATATTVGYDGEEVHRWTPKLHGIEIGVDGVPAWAGFFRQPLDHGPDEMLLPARGYNALLFEDTLGRVEQLNHYAGWGDFERYPVGSTPPGMRIPDGCTAVVVYDAVRGVKGLRVTGPSGAWVSCPRIGLRGQANVGRTAEGSTFGRWPEAFEVGDLTVMTRTQRSDHLAQMNEDYSLREGGTRPDSGAGWCQDPVTSGCVMTESTKVHHTWVDLRCHPDGIVYDEVGLRQGILTGFLAPTDGSLHVQRIFRDLQSVALGGFDYGLVDVVIESLVGSDEFAQVFNHNGTYMAGDVLASVMNRDGGAEAYWSAVHELRIAGRLGRVRDDILLNRDNIIEAQWAIDPGDEADEFVGLTGRGSGTSMIASTVSQPRVPFTHRVTKIARIPNGLSLNAADAWTVRHARVAASQQATGTTLVPWEVGREIARGDTVPQTLSAGRHGWWDPIRVLNKRWIPAQEACLLTWGGRPDA